MLDVPVFQIERYSDCVSLNKLHLECKSALFQRLFPLIDSGQPVLAWFQRANGIWGHRFLYERVISASAMAGISRVPHVAKRIPWLSFIEKKVGTSSFSVLAISLAIQNALINKKE